MKLWALYRYIEDGHYVMYQLFEAELDARDAAAKPHEDWEEPFVKEVYPTPPLKRKIQLKQMIVMRSDLNMRKGKMVAQGAHASLAAALANRYDPRVKEWLDGSFTKICVRVDSEEELAAVYSNAVEAGLIAEYIVDNGATEFDGVKTPTCCAIGPDTIEELAPITGHLRLL